MGDAILAKPQERLVSLDVFRGVTIAMMVLVNNPGTWGAMYAPLGHAKWDGWTPTDFIFPFFLFIVGVAMTFSFDKRQKQGAGRLDLFLQVCRRTIILFLLGMTLHGFPNFRLIAPYILVIAGLGFIFRHKPVLGGGDSPQARTAKVVGWTLAGAGVLWFFADFGHFQGPNRTNAFSAMFPLTNDAGGSIIRIPGVLQRIAVCYFLASLIAMFTGTWGRLAWALGLINLYWIVMRYIPAPGGYEIVTGGRIVRDAPIDALYSGALNDWIDVKLLGEHLYRYRPDPEGILSSIPAVATVLLGVLTGSWLRSDRSPREKAFGLFIAGNVLIIVGACMDFYFPINKKIWSSSYVVFMAGWALLFLAVCYYLNDIKMWRKWSFPFVIYGTNAILVFFASGIMARMLSMIRWTSEGQTVVLKTWIFENGFRSWLEPKDASLAFAICYVALWVFLTWPLFHRKIFLKV